MKNWSQLFVRHGWMFIEKEENIFDGNEHTDQEYLDGEACYQTAILLIYVFKRTRELRTVLKEIHRKKKNVGIFSGRTLPLSSF